MLNLSQILWTRGRAALTALFVTAVVGWLFAVPVAAQAAPQTQNSELTASDAQPADYLGTAVAEDGSTVVAGAPGHTSSGAAYVFVRPGGAWPGAMSEVAKLTPGSGAAGDQFGESVAVSGTTIAVGAPGATVNGQSNQGAVFVFQRPGRQWRGTLTPVAVLIAPDGNAGDKFGFSLALSGNTVVAGAPNHNVQGNDGQGAAYVYTRPGRGWSGFQTQAAELTTAVSQNNDQLGAAVALSGNNVVAGAPNRGVGGTAEVFARPGRGWSGTVRPAFELSASDAQAFDVLGTSVAIDGSTVVAGAPYHNTGGSFHQGAAEVFVLPRHGSGSLTQSAELTATDGQAGDRLGFSVAVAGSNVVAGAPFHKVIDTQQGSAYRFVMPRRGWSGGVSQTSEMAASDPEAADQFGTSLALSSTSLVVGAPYHQLGANYQQGAAYVFTVH